MVPNRATHHILSKLSKAASFRKWENSDINIAEQANIPQYYISMSKLNDIGTAVRLFESFFDHALVDIIVGHTKLYGHREKADTSLDNF